MGKRVLAVESCRALLEWCDVNLLHKNPLKSICTIQAIIDRAKTSQAISFSLEGLIDGYRVGFVDAGCFGASKLRDPRGSDSTLSHAVWVFN